MRDITRDQNVNVLTVAVRAQELGTGFVVIDDELVEVKARATTVDRLNVMFTFIRGVDPKPHPVMVAADIIFNAVVWPTCLANECVPVTHAQIARDQVTR